MHIFRVEYPLEFWGTHSTTTADADCFMKQRLTIDVNVTCNDFFSGTYSPIQHGFLFFFVVVVVFRFWRRIFCIEDTPALDLARLEV